MVRLLKEDYRKAALDSKTRAILEFSRKMTTNPSEMKREDVDALKAEDLSDAAILHVAQIAGFFNYFDRVADALGVELDPGMPHS